MVVLRPGMLPARPLGERLLARMRLQALERGDTVDEIARIAHIRGGAMLRSVWAWKSGERGLVNVDVAAEALDAVDLLLIDVYPQSLLDELLPPVTLD